MKRLLFTVLVWGLAAGPSAGAPSLGFWEEGAPGSGHFLWEFESGRVLPIQIPDVSSFNADPTVAQGQPAGVLENGNVITINGKDLVYDAQAGSFSSVHPLDVHVKVNNFPAPNLFKEVWVDVIGSGTIQPTNAAAVNGGPVTFTYESLPGPGPGTDFGWRIRPNPSWEEVEFSILPPATSAPAALESVHVDTICVPAPGALVLTGLGAAAVGWLRTRRRL